MCLPPLVSCFITAFITILGYGGMAGAIGGGGLGRIAINYGYHRYNLAVCLVATVLIVILVQIAQSVGTRVSNRLDHRITRATPKAKRHRAEKAGIG